MSRTRRAPIDIRTAAERADDPYSIDRWPETVTPSEIAKSYTREATIELYRLMNCSDSDAVRYQAAAQLLDRGWGKPVAEVQVVGAAAFVDVMAAREAAKELMIDPELRAQVRAALRGESSVTVPGGVAE